MEIFTPQAVNALILTALAGMSTLLGALIVFVTKGRSDKLISGALGFAGGVMVAVSFSDLLPNAWAEFGQRMGHAGGVVFSVVMVVAGVLLAMSLDRFVPHEPQSQEDHAKGHKDLYKVGIVSTLAIGLHNFPEGIATFMAGMANPALGASIALAIAMHNIPEGITVALPIYFSTGSRAKAIKLTFLSGIAEPIGALLAFLVLRPFVGPVALGIMLSLVAGIMLYIAFEELLPSSRQYGYANIALFATLAGACIMPLSHALQV